MFNKSTVRVMLYAMLMLVGLAGAGCEKMNSASQTAAALPADHGELIAVTPGNSPRQAVLWFKQADQTVLAVHVYVPRGTTKYSAVKRE